MADRKICFATDIHGSEICMRKFLNAGKFYRCDILIMGGDITGKMIVPIVDRGQAVHTATLYGRSLEVTGDGLAKRRKTIADAGFYAYDTTPEEMEHFRANPDAVTELFGTPMNRTLNNWLEMAEDRLAGTGIQCYFAPGNDDPIFVDDILRSSATVINPEEGQVDLGDGYTMVSVGYSNKTPWDSPRELPEDELAAYISKQGERGGEPRPGDLQLPRAAARDPDRPGRPAGRRVPPDHEGRDAGDRRGLDVRISVAVADEAAGLLAFAWMDGATRLSALTSVDKTRTVILTGVPTRDLGENLRSEMAEEPQLFHGMLARDLVHFSGGVPVLISGRLAGAVAVSGATSLQDHEIAGRAAAAVSG